MRGRNGCIRRSAIIRNRPMPGKHIHITGIVQGVGFRPFVYQLAHQHHLTGWVQNTSAGVVIQVEGAADCLSAFLTALQTIPPPRAVVHQIHVTDCEPENLTTFAIRHSAEIAGEAQPVAADMALCADCRREFHDPQNARYHYPFINCTNCGPRYTIIQAMPYDRPATTMAAFPMCGACAAEYHDPMNRRFHAQPTACAVCGPRVWLVENCRGVVCDPPKNSFEDENAIQTARQLLREGWILAIKGLGGFHLACDATHTEAVQKLRTRKHRPDKPLAVMMANLAQIQQYCGVNDAESALLTSPTSPIVLLQKRDDGLPLAEAVAPRQKHLGVMLPYTPLHDLIFEQDMPPLVMTSGNRAGEPIVTDNHDALTALGEIADAFLLHNREIHQRVDDSVVRVVADTPLILRRSRGYAPAPLDLPRAVPPILAVGAELKNTFCLAHQHLAFLSPHLGDLGDYQTLQAFESTIAHFEKLFRISPQVLAHDLHPDYFSTRYALRRAEHLPCVAVQHHHAHLAACLADNHHAGDTPVIGVCFDGTGYGTDGTIWGGEFLIADYAGFERAAHLTPMPLPGGDAATKHPHRIAAAYLLAGGLTDALSFLQGGNETDYRLLEQQMARGINTPYTSSMGRLFDAVAALLGICSHTSYEGQAAIELEAVTDARAEEIYPFEGHPAVVLGAILAEKRAGVATSVLAGRFHHTIAHWILTTCQRLSQDYALNEVALSGGVFQNVTLLSKTVFLLESAGFRVYTHRQLPPNDGGLALGQAMVAAANLNNNESQQGMTHEIS